MLTQELVEGLLLPVQPWQHYQHAHPPGRLVTDQVVLWELELIMNCNQLSWAGSWPLEMLKTFRTCRRRSCKLGKLLRKRWTPKLSTWTKYGPWVNFPCQRTDRRLVSLSHTNILGSSFFVVTSGSAHPELTKALARFGSSLLHKPAGALHNIFSPECWVLE